MYVCVCTCVFWNVLSHQCDNLFVRISEEMLLLGPCACSKMGDRMMLTWLASYSCVVSKECEFGLALCGFCAKNYKLANPKRSGGWQNSNKKKKRGPLNTKLCNCE